MKRKKGLATVVTIGLVVLSGAGIYFGLAGYYAERFCYGTWINGMYCTGKTVEEVNAELTAMTMYDTFTVVDRNANEFEISLEEIEYSMDYIGPLSEIKAGQAWQEWIKYYFEKQEYSVMPEVTFSLHELEEKLYQADFMHEEVLSVNNKAEILLTESGYVLRDHTANQIVPKKVCQVVSQALLDFRESVYLEESGCYYTMPVTQETMDIYCLWNEIYVFQSFQLTYTLGDREEHLTPGIVAEWIAVDEENGSFLRDENGKLMVDDEAVMAYVAWLGEEYDTVGKPREFLSTRGDLITIEKSVYGNDIDEEKECAQLLEDIREGRSGLVREPVYAQRAWSQGADDIGGTYIEVDMTEQMLYYYVDREIALETPVVTGNMRRGWDTPAVVCSVYGMARNRVLRGANYATFVYYWMPVYGNIGLHDATWRRTFGEDIYLTDGSHGCINMPKDMAAELYGMIEIGTPVILFY